MWGQDVGIVSKVVQNCIKKLCKGWWEIAADAIAIALGVEVVWIFGALGVYKLVSRARYASTNQPLFLEFRAPFRVVLPLLDWLDDRGGFLDRYSVLSS